MCSTSLSVKWANIRSFSVGCCRVAISQLGGGGAELSSLAAVTALLLFMWQLDYPEISRVPLCPVDRCLKSSVTKCQQAASTVQREKAVPPGG